MHESKRSTSAPEGSGEPSVPVSMCSPKFTTIDVAGFIVSEVWFPPGATVPRHTHERAVLGVMLGGSFDNRFATCTLEPTAGSYFTEPGEEPHSNYVGTAGAHVLVLQPDPLDEELTTTCSTLLDSIGSQRHAGVVASAWRMAREIKASDAVSKLAAESLALDIIVSATRFSDALSEPGWLARVDELIGDCFRERMSVDGIAREVGVHRAHLARAYKQHRGVPVATSIRHLRLEWAAARLSTSTTSISRVALEAGFSDQSHLTRQFKRRYGVPPGVFRRTARS